MKIIVGLGNPGLRYRKTRHNAGFMALNLLARRHRLRFRKRTYSSRCAEGRVAGEEVLLAKPQTYMNRSGRAVGALGSVSEVASDEMLIVTDDIDLPLGRIRLRGSGSAGGHNGLRSIIERVGPDFARLKLGVASGRIYEASDYVLSSFKRGETSQLSEMLENAADCMETWLSEGLRDAMNKYNGM